MTDAQRAAAAEGEKLLVKLVAEIPNGRWAPSRQHLLVLPAYPGYCIVIGALNRMPVGPRPSTNVIVTAERVANDDRITAHGQFRGDSLHPRRAAQVDPGLLTLGCRPFD